MPQKNREEITKSGKTICFLLGKLLPVGGVAAPRIVVGAEGGVHSLGSAVKALGLTGYGEHGAGDAAPIPALVQSDFLAKGVALAILAEIDGLVEIHALNELLGGAPAATA